MAAVNTADETPIDSDFEGDFEGESSDVYSPSESSNSEDEDSADEVSEEDSELSDSSTENVASVWTRVYPPEPDSFNNISFTERNPGVKNMPPPQSSPLVYFYLFLTQEILLKIVNETRRYANQYFRDRELSPGSRASRWERLQFGVDHLKKYLGLTLLMGLVKKRNLSMYWNKTFACLSTPYFSKVMPRNVYQLISQFLHLSDNSRPEAQRDSERYDPLYKFRVVLDGLNDGCKRYFVPRQLISIDESLIGLKNRTELIQYIPNKHHHKWGVKLYAVTDSATGYPLHTTVYCGKKRSGASSQFGHSYDVVKDLMTKAGLFNKGYHLFVDNFYTSPTLAEFLFKNQTLLTGTLRANRKGVPNLLKKAKPKAKECSYFRKGPLLALSWREKKSQKNPCLMLSTGVPAGMVNHRRRDGSVKELPEPVSMYNKHMGGVDLLDQQVDYVAGERPFHKFWKKCFFAIVDRMAYCAFVLYDNNCPATDKLSRFGFMSTLVEELCSTRLNDQVPAEVPHEHRIGILPSKKEKDCVVCSDRTVPGGRKRARTQCEGCRVGVHLKCFDLLDHKAKKKKTTDH